MDLREAKEAIVSRQEARFEIEDHGGLFEEFIKFVSIYNTAN